MTMPKGSWSSFAFHSGQFLIDRDLSSEIRRFHGGFQRELSMRSLIIACGFKNKTPRKRSEGFILKRTENTYFLLAVFFLAFFLVAMNVLLS